MLICHNDSHLRKYFREALEREPNTKEETIEVPLEYFKLEEWKNTLPKMRNRKK